MSRVVLLYWAPSGDSTTTLCPVLSSTKYGSGLKVGVNLFFLSCLNNTMSPSFTSLSCARCFSSAYNFLSPWLHCLYHVRPGHLLEILRFLVCGFATFYGTGVLQGLLQRYCDCGVVLCIDRKDAISSFQFLFSICAILILFSREWFCLSTSPFT